MTLPLRHLNVEMAEWGRSVFVHLLSNLSLHHQVAPSQNAEVENSLQSNLCFFSPQGRQEVWKSRPLDYSCMPNLALMGEGVGTGVLKIQHVVLWPTGVTVYTSINVNFCLV